MPQIKGPAAAYSARALLALLVFTVRTASGTVTIPQVAVQGELRHDEDTSLRQSRLLLDTENVADTEDAVITQVATFQELIDALEGGQQDIEITAHMDATSFGLIPALINGVEFKHQLPPLNSKTRSIRGACATAPDADFIGRIAGTPLLELLPNQCVILSMQAVLPVAEGQAWVDNVYFRFASNTIGEEVVASSPPAPLHVHSGEAYVTNVTIQGDGVNEVAGFWVFPSASVLMIDSMIANSKLAPKAPLTEGGIMGYRRLLDAPAWKAPPVVAVQASPTYLLRTTFQDIELPESGHVILGDVAANIYLQEVTFNNVSATRPAGSIGGATFYKDGEPVLVGNNDGAAADPSESLALSLSAGIVPEPLDSWDTFFVNIQKTIASPSATRITHTEAVRTGAGVGVDRETPTTPVAEGQAATAPAGTADTGDGGSGGSNTGVIVGAIIAGTILLVALIAGALWYFNQKQRRADKEQEKREARDAAFGGQYGTRYSDNTTPGGYGAPTGPYAVAGGPNWGPPPGKGSYAGSNYDQTNFSNGSSNVGSFLGPGGYGPPPPGAYGGGPPQQYGIQTAYGSTPSLNAQSNGPQMTNPFPHATMTATNMDDFTNMSHSTPSPSVTRSSNARTRDPGDPVEPLAEDASIDVKIERLHKQLDGMHAVSKPLLGHYEILSHANRRQGGQGVVQFARGVTDQLDYAIKFFVSKKAFHEEGDFYKNSPLGSMLPKCLALCSNEDNIESDAHGIALPSFLIMEKGESLDEWSRRAKPDNFQAVAMLANIAKRLSHMHDAGFVHRDLKPGNVMWLPRENRWTVIDFGCVAKAGEPAAICYSLRYTAPEVIQALDSHEKEIVPQPTMDCWALGVMAYELLTGGPAFQILVDGPRQIIAQLKGDAELPWEGTRANPEVMRKLRTLRRPVMALLERDPDNRPSLNKFCDQCDDIFGTRTLKG